MLGALVMTHSDDAGLVLPPAIAPVQVARGVLFRANARRWRRVDGVGRRPYAIALPRSSRLCRAAPYAHRSISTQVALVPIVKGMDKDPEGTQTVMSLVDKVVDECEALGLRVKVDDRENMRPGAKYFEWERKGAPLRLEVGPRDAAQNVMVVASRLGGEKQTIAVDEVPSYLKKRLDEMQAKLFADASTRLKDRTIDIATYEDMKSKIANEDLGFFRVYWKADDANEKAIKEDCAATIRCYPLDAQGDLEGKTCFYSGEPATHVALFARAF